ncbi:hypothetical protein [Myroides sp. N17-2]|uniref:hypothetical protein n=1 Tax=Myroides sp. N17-2 TaxID=2030799 RepID=UPI000EFD3FA4|nr:hypothetical protein [Myroides sp. N17-2]
MEIVIIISLVIVIALLLLDKKPPLKKESQATAEELPFKQDVRVSVMGESKPVILKQSIQTEQEINIEEEEQELVTNIEPLDSDFTQRVNQKELSRFVNSVKQELIDEATIETAKKLDGSALLELLEQAMPNSAKSIAKLLDQSLNVKSPKKQDQVDSQDFNISDFV